MAIHVKNIVVAEKVENNKTSTLSAIRGNGKRTVVNVNVIKTQEQEQKQENPSVSSVKSFSEVRANLAQIEERQEQKQPARKPMSDWLKRKDSEYTNLLTEN
jgi:hypothetical protein